MVPVSLHECRVAFGEANATVPLTRREINKRSNEPTEEARGAQWRTLRQAYQ